MAAIGADMVGFPGAHQTGLDLTVGPDQSSAMVATNGGRDIPFGFANCIRTVDQNFAPGNIHQHWNTSSTRFSIDFKCRPETVFGIFMIV